MAERSTIPSSRMLDESDLTAAERALCVAAAAGRLLDRCTRRPEEDDPAQGRAWGHGREIRAQLLRQLLTGQGLLDQSFGLPLAVRLRGASVTGRLNLGGLTLRCPLELYDCYLGGRLDLAKTNAPDISLRGSHLHQRLSARHLRLTHNLNLTGGFRCNARVDLRNGQIGGSLDGEKATLANPGGEALAADGLDIAGGLFLSNAEVTGEVRLLGARIGGQLTCDQATLANPGGRALNADRLSVSWGVFLPDARVTGEVRLLGAHIGGQLACHRATLANPGRRALNADRLSVDGDLFLTNAEVTGEVRLLGAHIGGQLACDRATLTNPGGRAFNADGLEVDAGLFLRGSEVTGEIRLLGAHIGGQLPCNGATLANPAGLALNADRLAIDGNLMLSNADVTGEVRLLGAHVGGNLDCDGATLSNPGGKALNLERASIAETVGMRVAHLDGSLNLNYARVGAWYDDHRTWPRDVESEGFVYEAIHAPDVTPRQRLSWLRRHQRGYLPQPYEQLAAVYRRAGHDQAARTVAIAKQQARRADVTRRWARGPSRLWSFFLRWTIGYGYRPALVLPYLAGLFALGSVVFDHAHPTQLRPARSGPEQPDFNAARYTLDLLLPVANLKQRESFIPHDYAVWWAFGLSLAGWLLAGVVVAGLTGVFKRD